MRTGQEVHPNLVAPDVREWVVVDGIGGSAHGLVPGAPLRRGHAWLHASGPLGEPVTALLGLEERLRTDRGLFDLAPLFSAETSADRATVEHFAAQPWPTWRFRAGEVVLERSLFMVHGHHAIVIGYRHLEGGSARLRLSPLLVARDPEAIPRENPELLGTAQAIPGRVRFQTSAEGPTITLWHQGGFTPNRLWRRGIEHALEPRKSEEDALVPGHLDSELEPGETAVLVASTEEGLFRTLAVEGRLGTPPPSTLAECVAVLAQTERGRRSAVMASAIQGADYTARQAAAAHGDGVLARRPSPLVEPDDPWTQRLAWSAVQGLARRNGRLTLLDPLPLAGERATSALRALPGLVSMRAFDSVREILDGFAARLDDGLLAVDGGAAEAAPDAEPSLWMIHVAELLARRSEDAASVGGLYATLESVLQYYRGGTRGGIKVDGDGLLEVGEGEARRKPAALNALWYHALVAMAQLARLMGRKENAAFSLAWARQHGQRFNDVFWDESGMLFDAWTPAGPVVGQRPSHLLAISLTPALLPPERARRLVTRITESLFTPLGLKPEPDAVQVETAWLGTFLSAFLRAHGRSAEAQAKVRDWLRILRGRLDESTSGPIPATFDWPARRARRGAPLPPLEEARPRGVSPLAAAELLRAWIEDVAHVEANAPTA